MRGSQELTSTEGTAILFYDFRLTSMYVFNVELPAVLKLLFFCRIRRRDCQVCAAEFAHKPKTRNNCISLVYDSLEHSSTTATTGVIIFAIISIAPLRL